MLGEFSNLFSFDLHVIKTGLAYHIRASRSINHNLTQISHMKCFIRLMEFYIVLTNAFELVHIRSGRHHKVPKKLVKGFYVTMYAFLDCLVTISVVEICSE